MTLAERIRKNEMEERMKAKKEGIKEGKKEGINMTIKAMLLKNMDESIIKDVTGIKDKELKNIKEELLRV